MVPSAECVCGSKRVADGTTILKRHDDAILRKASSCYVTSDKEVPSMAEKVLKKRMWKFVFYPESCPDWKEIIEDWGLPVIVSPLHNLDVKEDGTGEIKKAHYHGIMEFDGPTPYPQALELVEGLGVHIVKPVNSRRRDERYLCHLDSKGKTDYDICDLTTFGGYECKFLGERYEMDTISQIHDLAEELGIVYYADLANEIIERHPDLVTTLLRYPAHFNNWCYSRERILSKHGNGSYVNYAITRGRLGR